MKYIVIFFCVSLSTACAQKEFSPCAAPDSGIPVLDVSMYESPWIAREEAIEHPYEIGFEVVKVDHDEYVLQIDMKLFGGSFYVSPFSTQDFKGKFRVEVAPNAQMELGTEIVETPRTQPVIDLHPFVNGEVNWVTENTTYGYPLILNTHNDFEIGGKIIFTIEPKCTLEEIPMIFKYKDGELRVEKWEC